MLAWLRGACKCASVSPLSTPVRQSLASSETFTEEGIYLSVCSWQTLQVTVIPYSLLPLCRGLYCPQRRKTCQTPIREVPLESGSQACSVRQVHTLELLFYYAYLHLLSVSFHALYQAAGTNEVAEVARAATQLKQQQQQQQTATASDQPKEYLYEPKFGLPLVRRRLSYGELLREIRTENVKQLKFFETADNIIDLEGPCLVVFKDDTLAQGYVPHYDYRIAYAMENHGVVAARLPAEPAPEMLVNSAQKMWDENARKVVTNVVPVIAIGLIYFATQLAAKWKVSACCWHACNSSPLATRNDSCPICTAQPC